MAATTPPAPPSSSQHVSTAHDARCAVRRPHARTVGTPHTLAQTHPTQPHPTTAGRALPRARCAHIVVRCLTTPLCRACTPAVTCRGGGRGGTRTARSHTAHHTTSSQTAATPPPATPSSSQHVSVAHDACRAVRRPHAHTVGTSHSFGPNARPTQPPPRLRERWHAPDVRPS